MNRTHNIRATFIFNLEVSHSNMIYCAGVITEFLFQSNQDKVDLAVQVPATLFLKPLPISGADFAEKLASGDIQHLTSRKFQSSKSFQEVRHRK
jgi:hypothetical protein